MYIKFSEHKILEVNWYRWNPLKSITFKCYFNILFKGDHSPAISIELDLLCFAFGIEFYDNRHEEERGINESKIN